MVILQDQQRAQQFVFLLQPAFGQVFYPMIYANLRLSGNCRGEEEK